jgi:hypothetical protein
MTDLFIALTAVGAAWFAAFATLHAVAAWRRWRGTRLVTCPETGRPAAVDMDLRRAIGGSIVGRPDLRLRDCSRWPERGRCGQPCLSQVEESPEGCLVRAILQDWYAEHTCAFCRRPFGLIHWHDHKPGLRAPDGRLREWREVPPEMLPDTLATHRAVCWNCMVAEGFRLRFPDLVVERPAAGRHEPPVPPA